MVSKIIQKEINRKGRFHNRWKGGKKRVVCDECGKIEFKFPCYIKERKTHFCSRKCKGVHQTRNLSGKNSVSWKGGRLKVLGGYIRVYMPNHPFCDKQGYILEHRLVMEKLIGRYLKPKEVVHHINKDTSDNRISNLILFLNCAAHTRYHKELNELIKRYE